MAYGRSAQTVRARIGACRGAVSSTPLGHLVLTHPQLRLCPLATRRQFPASAAASMTAKGFACRGGEARRSARQRP